jgi:hypothetical protein
MNSQFFCIVLVAAVLVVEGSGGMRWEVSVCAVVARRVAKGGEQVGRAWWEVSGGTSMGEMMWLMVGSGQAG